MTKYINHIKTLKSLTLIFDSGDPIIIPKSDKRFARVVALIESAQYDHIPKAANEGLVIKAANSKFKLVNGQIMIGDDYVPAALSRRIIQFVESGLDTGPLEKFWDRLKKNPSADSRKDLFTFLEKNHAPITHDGYFIGYRYVRDNFKDGYTGKIDNSPGKTVSMPRESVDPNRNNTCSRGLHVAAYRYASTMIRHKRLIEVKVDPRDVVAVPPDYNQQKMRVCKFVVLREISPKGDRQEQVYKGDRKTEKKARKVGKFKKITRRIRIPSEYKRIEVDGRHDASIPNGALEKIGLQAGHEVFVFIATDKSKSITISGVKPKNYDALKKVGRAATYPVGRKVLKVRRPFFRLTDLLNYEFYDLTTRKGDLMLVRGGTA